MTQKELWRQRVLCLITFPQCLREMHQFVFYWVKADALPLHNLRTERSVRWESEMLVMYVKYMVKLKKCSQTLISWHYFLFSSFSHLMFLGESCSCQITCQGSFVELINSLCQMFCHVRVFGNGLQQTWQICFYLVFVCFVRRLKRRHHSCTW